MNDLDVLADRLHELGQRAPVPAADPHVDIRRGRAALRRRHARSAAGVTTALVAAGAVATTFPGMQWGGQDRGTAFAPAGSPSNATSSTSSPTPAPHCTVLTGETALTHEDQLIALSNPEVASALAGYRQAAATILDPSKTHIDVNSKMNRGGGGRSTCNPATGEERLASLSTVLGWASGDALGSIAIEVSRTNDPEKAVPNPARWNAYDGALPDGVTKALVTDNGAVDGGYSLVVERADGLTIYITTSGTWGNNVPPGAPSATDLPGVDELVTLAASPLLTFPGR